MFQSQNRRQDGYAASGWVNYCSPPSHLDKRLFRSTCSGITNISACRIVRSGSEAKLLRFRVGFVLWSDQLRRRNSGQPLLPYTAFRDWSLTSDAKLAVVWCSGTTWVSRSRGHRVAQRSRPLDLRGPAYRRCRHPMGCVARRKRRSNRCGGSSQDFGRP